MKSVKVFGMGMLLLAAFALGGCAQASSQRSTAQEQAQSLEKGAVPSSEMPEGMHQEFGGW